VEVRSSSERAEAEVQAVHEARPGSSNPFATFFVDRCSNLSTDLVFLWSLKEEFEAFNQYLDELQAMELETAAAAANQSADPISIEADLIDGIAPPASPSDHLQQPQAGSSSAPGLPSQQQQQAQLIYQNLRRPIDINLEKIQSKLYYDRYLTPEHFLSDLNKIVENAELDLDDTERLWKAKQMVTQANLLVDGCCDAAFRLECQRMAEREADREKERERIEGPNRKGKGREVVSSAVAEAKRHSTRGSGAVVDQSMTDPVALERMLKRQQQSIAEDVEMADPDQPPAKRARVDGETANGHGIETANGLAAGATVSAIGSIVGVENGGASADGRLQLNSKLMGDLASILPSAAINGSVPTLPHTPPISTDDPMPSAQISSGLSSPPLSSQPTITSSSVQPVAVGGSASSSPPTAEAGPSRPPPHPLAEEPLASNELAPRFDPSTSALEQISGGSEMDVDATTNAASSSTTAIDEPSAAQSNDISSAAAEASGLSSALPTSLISNPTPSLRAPSSPPRAPTPPPFLLPTEELSDLTTSLTTETSLLNVEQLEQLRAMLLDCVWRRRAEWDREGMVLEMSDTMREFVREVREDLDGIGGGEWD
jgi:hypothetical protein